MDKKTKISIEIEKIAQANPDLGYLDAIIMYADQHEIDIVDMQKYVSDSLKSKLYVEGMENRTVKEKNESASLENYVK